MPSVIGRFSTREKAMSQFPEITAANFKSEVLESSQPVLVDLYADWCGPCKVLGKLLEQLWPILQNHAKVVKINVEDQPELADAFSVSSIPMLVVFKNGQVVDRSVGLVPVQKVLEMVQKAA
jgi:thioredoxin 1